MRLLSLLLGLCVGMAGLAAAPLPALADACFDHNGSTMRVTNRNGQMTIRYERPREALRPAGVRRGTVLVDAVEGPSGIRGTARVFSRHCPGDPLTYGVAGHFEGDESVFLEGRRQVYSQCQPTGRTTTDTLEFFYVGEC